MVIHITILYPHSHPHWLALLLGVPYHGGPTLYPQGVPGHHGASAVIAGSPLSPGMGGPRSARIPHALPRASWQRAAPPASNQGSSARIAALFFVGWEPPRDQVVVLVLGLVGTSCVSGRGVSPFWEWDPPDPQDLKLWQRKHVFPQVGPWGSWGA